MASQATQVGRQATSQAHLLPGEGSSSAQAGAHLPSGEGSNLLASQAVHSQAGTHLPPREGSNVLDFQAGANLPPREGSNLVASQATQSGRQSASQAGAHLPPGKEAVQQHLQSPRQVLNFPQGKEATH